MKHSVGVHMDAPKMEVVMHVQVATYRLDPISDPDFIEANQEFAEMMNGVPGLVAKLWLRGDDDVYGGVYLWEDKEACENFLASELWGGALTDESLKDLESNDFVVMDELTKTTQPGMAMV